MEIRALSEIQHLRIAPPSQLEPERIAAHAVLISAVARVNETELLGQGSELAFRFDRDTKHAVIEVLDKNTGEVIRQIPPEYLLRVMESLCPPDPER